MSLQSPSHETQNQTLLDVTNPPSSSSSSEKGKVKGKDREQPPVVSLKRKHESMGRDGTPQSSSSSIANGNLAHWVEKSASKSSRCASSALSGRVRNGIDSMQHERPKGSSLPNRPSVSAAADGESHHSSPSRPGISRLVTQSHGEITPSSKSSKEFSSSSPKPLPLSSSTPEIGRVSANGGNAAVTAAAAVKASSPLNGQLHGKSSETKPSDGQTQHNTNRRVDRTSAAAILRASTNHFQPRSLPTSYDKFNAVEIFRQKLSRIPGPPVTLSPDTDTKDLNIDLNFQFVDYYKLGEGVIPIDEEFKFGCDCPGGICDPETCTCAREGGERVGLPEGSDEVDDADFIPPYIQNSRGMTVLNPEFATRQHNHIFECSPRCSCNKDCWNRVSQDGRKVRLELFKTEHCGIGIRSPDHIYQGQFIGLYKGEVITKDESDRRLKALGDVVSYQFSLDKLEPDDFYVVDGRRFGSVTRYVNHSCNPNIVIKTISHCVTEEKIIEIAFFALKDIPPGVELRFDYNPQESHEKVTKINPDAVKCRCGEPNCRGQLWPNSR